MSNPRVLLCDEISLGLAPIVIRRIYAALPRIKEQGTSVILVLAVALIAIIGSWYVSRTRLGFALRAIGEDETVARHTGINTTRVKVLCFALSASVMALVGAVLALRYPYIDAAIAFNNTWSFQVLIAALLGGPGRPWGPAVGAIPLVLLSEYFSGTFPRHFPIALGLCFVIVVYFLPGGIAPLIERCSHAFDAAAALRALRTGRLPESWEWPRRLKIGLKAGVGRLNAFGRRPWRRRGAARR